MRFASRWQQDRLTRLKKRTRFGIPFRRLPKLLLNSPKSFLSEAKLYSTLIFAKEREYDVMRIYFPATRKTGEKTNVIVGRYSGRRWHCFGYYAGKREEAKIARIGSGADSL